MEIHPSQTTVAPDRTHHLHCGKPLYSARFQEVLSFHAPGLAPVIDSTGAYHIDYQGTPVYSKRFRRTFGFYEGRAAVVDDKGEWFHILPDGIPLSPTRYAWCGNYQKGFCTVRDHDKRYYFHITLDGQRAYPESYRYAGDFREDSAVVQNAEGLHTHIANDGTQLHGKWFRNLDVYHKGFARAKDKGGWCHIDASGEALYEARYANVEPFYNGQARVEDRYGNLLIIDETGRVIVELRKKPVAMLQDISGDIVGFWKTRTIAAVVESEIFEMMPGTTEAIANSLGWPSGNTHRFLRALWELDLVSPSKGTWHTTSKGHWLLDDHHSCLNHAARYWSMDHYEQWKHLGRALRGERPSVGVSYFEALSGKDLETFHRGISGYALFDYENIVEKIDWHRHEHVIDAGGSTGTLLFHIIEKCEHLRGILLDLPGVVSIARVPQSIQDRIALAGRNFFENWQVQGDAVILARVMHDWDDEHAIRILRNAKKAIYNNGKLYVIEMVLPEDRPNGGLLDMNMLVMTGGKERTRKNWERLFEEAGFRLGEVTELSPVCSILEGDFA